MALLLLFITCSGASAYNFAKGSDTDLKVYFNDPGDWQIAIDSDLASQVAEEGAAYADENDIDLKDRSLGDMADEIQFHAKVYFLTPNIPFPSHGRMRFSHEAANPADVGDDDEYWSFYGPDVYKLVMSRTAMENDP